MHLWDDGMSLGLVYKNGEHIFDEVCGEVPFLTYPLFEKTGVVKSAFSTRIGGVSKGCYESMNLSFDRGDDKDAVMENFQRIASAIGTNCHDMVLSRQTHTANVRVVTEEDKGKGIFKISKATGNLNRFSNSPESCFIDNGDVREKKVPDYLDKEWYIRFCIKRLKDFGVNYVRADGVVYEEEKKANSRDVVWMEKYMIAKQMIERGVVIKSSTVSDGGVKIGTWLQSQKKKLKEGKQIEERVELLREIGVG